MFTKSLCECKYIYKTSASYAWTQKEDLAPRPSENEKTMHAALNFHNIFQNKSVFFVDAPGRKNSAATLSFAGRTFVQLLAFPPAHKKSLVGIWGMGRCAVNKRFERREMDSFLCV